MGRRRKHQRELLWEANAKRLMPYGPDEGCELGTVPRERLEWLLDSLPRSERWLKRFMALELKRRNRISYEGRRNSVSASLRLLEGKDAGQMHAPVKQFPDRPESYAGTMSAWGVPHPDCWDDMSDEGRRRWNEQQSKLWMKRPLGSR